MKRTVIAGLACIAAFSISVPVFAHGQHQYYCEGQNCDRDYCFIDEDGDGICDNSRCVDEDGNSVCGAGVYGSVGGSGVCRYFIDEDEDGICDHCVNQEAYVQPKAQSSSNSSYTSTARTGGHHGSRHGHGGHH